MFFSCVPESSSLMFAKASQLPALLESEKRQREEETKQLKRERAVRERQFKTYYQVTFVKDTSYV